MPDYPYVSVVFVRFIGYNRTMTLSRLRATRKLSLQKVADKMEVSRSTVDKIERARNPHILTLQRYATAIGIPLSEIVSVYEKMYENNVQNP